MFVSDRSKEGAIPHSVWGVLQDTTNPLRVPGKITPNGEQPNFSLWSSLERGPLTTTLNQQH